ncbi:MAG: hypothetical protein R2764_21795 [Bacteroidales bacterium]
MLEFPYSGEDGKYFKSLYKHLELDYPKYYKMDALCKLAFLTAEFLLEGIDLKHKYQPSEIALVFANSSSSLNTDIKHNQSISDKDQYFPKPAVFVYTLPNIMLGELSIRHTFRGENVFFVAEKFDSQMLVDYTTNLLNTTRHKACIIGWVDFLAEGFESAMFLVEDASHCEQGELLSTEGLQKLFYF